MLSWAVCLDIEFPFMFQRVVSCEKISEKVVCVHYSDNHYQISVDMIKPIGPPDFTYGEWVSPVNRPELVGFISDIIFHFANDMPMYFLSIDSKRKPKRYFARDLILANNQLLQNQKPPMS